MLPHLFGVPHLQCKQTLRLFCVGCMQRSKWTNINLFGFHFQGNEKPARHRRVFQDDQETSR